MGDTVRRPVGPGGARVHELLLALEDVGFAYSPRFLGIDDRGREVLTWIDGESGPDGWSKVVPEEGLRRFARLLRAVHDATADLRLPGDGWAGGRTGPSLHQVICHGDFGPWNVVWDGPEPVGIIDWDFAGPAPAEDDVAYALEYAAPFRDDDEAIRWMRYLSAPDRRRRAEIFCDAYGLHLDDVPGAVAARQEQDIDRVIGLAAAGVEPQATWVADGVEAELRQRVAWTRTTGARLFQLSDGDGPREWDGLTMRTRAEVLAVLSATTIDVILRPGGGSGTRTTLPLHVVPPAGRMPNTVLRLVNTRSSRQEPWRGWTVEAVEGVAARPADDAVAIEADHPPRSSP